VAKAGDQKSRVSKGRKTPAREIAIAGAENKCLWRATMKKLEPNEIGRYSITLHHMKDGSLQITVKGGVSHNRKSMLVIADNLRHAADLIKGEDVK
jgi:hypothetical protein